MEQILLEILKQTPAIGGVLAVLWMGKGIIEKVVAHFLAEIQRQHDMLVKLIASYEAHVSKANAVAAQLHEQLGASIEGQRQMNAHLEQCASLVERIHDDNMRMRRDNAA